jgi:hypothetical protein
MSQNRNFFFIRGTLFCLPAIIILLIAGACYAGMDLTASPSQVDLGLIDEGTPATASFTIENTGTSEVVIQGVKTN